MTEPCAGRPPNRLDLQHVGTWLLLNGLVAFTVPLQVAARFFYVYRMGGQGRYPIAGWFAIWLGCMSLFTALAYSWRRVQAGTVLGVILCVGAMGFSFQEGMHDLLKEGPLTAKWWPLLTLLGWLSLYGLQLRFVITRFSKGLGYGPSRSTTAPP